MSELPHDPHFLRHISGLSERREIVTHTAIFSRQGIKLVETGRVFTSSLYEKLIAHKLNPPIEDCLSVADPVTAASVMHDIEELLDTEAGFAALVPPSVTSRSLVHVFSTLPLSPPIAFKLTVAREERSEVYRHSLRVAYCAAAIALNAHESNREIINSAAAGLFHDLGLLHVDPIICQAKRVLQDHERHHLYSHPLTTYLMLKRDTLWHPIVSTAVLEHHERLDGSGYPKGLDVHNLGRLGQLLAIAELASALLEGGNQDKWGRLGVVLRMNKGKLNEELSNLLLSMFPRATTDGPGPHFGSVLESLVDIAIAVLRWKSLRGQIADSSTVALIDHRMERFSHNLADAGIDLDYWAAMDAEIELDVPALHEMDAAAREGIWQLHAISHEIRRRWGAMATSDIAMPEVLMEWLSSIDSIASSKVST